MTERDRPLLDGELLKAFTWTGEAAEVRMRIDALADDGRDRDPLRADGARRPPRAAARSWRWRLPESRREGCGSGLFAVNMGVSAEPEELVATARAAEAAGFESLWAGEHVMLPDPQAPPSPMAPQDAALDPLLALAWAAAHTTTIRLATGIIILPQRNPVVLAKQIASLDVLSGGRFTFGIGVGYLEPEFRAIGADFENGARSPTSTSTRCEHLWYDERPEFHGRFADFSGVDAYPRPVQRPIPIVFGGAYANARTAAPIAGGNGWYGFAMTPDDTVGAPRRGCAPSRPRSNGPRRSARSRSR